MCIKRASHKLTSAQRKRRRRHQQRHKPRIQKPTANKTHQKKTQKPRFHPTHLLLLEKPTNGLIFPHKKNISTMNPHVSRPTHPTSTPAINLTLQNTFRKLSSPSTYPIKANTNNSCGSNGKSIVKFVLNTGVTV